MKLTEEKIEKEEQQWEQEKGLQDRKFQLEEEKRSFKQSHRHKISTSKLLIIFLFINCSLIELFTGWVTIQTLKVAESTVISPDFTPLVTLIGAVVSEVVGFAVYALKSARENTAGGIVFEQAMAAMSNDDDTTIIDDDEEEAMG